MTPMMRMPALRQVRRTPDGPWWRRLLDWFGSAAVYEVVEEFSCAVNLSNGFWNLTLPAGFRSDLATTPRLSWLFGFRPDGPLLIPGLFHDFWYRHGQVLVYGERGESRGVVVGKWTADLMFMDLVGEMSGLRLPGLVGFIALTLFGLPAWRANAKHRRAYAETGQFQLHGDYKDDGPRQHGATDGD